MTLLVRWTATVTLLVTLLAGPLSGTVRAQDDAARAQVDATSAAMLALDSFHFDLETTSGVTTFQGGFELERVTGDVSRPSSFQAQVVVRVVIISLTLEVIGIGSDIWVKNPIGGDDTFIQVTGGDSEIQLPPTVLLNPDALVSQALTYLDDPQVAGTEMVDGQEMTVLTGTFDPSRLVGSGTPVADFGTFNPSSTPLAVKAWIDDQNRLVRIDFIGPIFGFEEGTGRLVRSITFSQFDEPVTIQPPA